MRMRIVLIYTWAWVLLCSQAWEGCGVGRCGCLQSQLLRQPKPAAVPAAEHPHAMPCILYSHALSLLYL